MGSDRRGCKIWHYNRILRGEETCSFSFFLFLGDVFKICRILSKRYLGEDFKLKHSTYDGQEGTDFDGLLGEIPKLPSRKNSSRVIGLENDLKSGKLSMELTRRSKIPSSRSKIKADFFIPSFLCFRRLQVGLDIITLCLPHISLDGGGWLYYCNLSYTKRWAIYKFGKRSYNFFYITVICWCTFDPHLGDPFWSGKGSFSLPFQIHSSPPAEG